MSGHTPGPWITCGADWRGVCAEKGMHHVAWCGGFPREQAKADAILIAAAPDLLAALEALLPTMRCMERHGHRFDPAQVDPAQVDAAISAIAKAKGAA